MPRYLNKQEYDAAQKQIIFLGMALENAPFGSFLATISQSEAVGSLLEPTAFREAADRLQALKKFVEALERAQIAFGAFKGVVSDTESQVAKFRERQT